MEQITNYELLERVDLFLRSISKSDKVAIVHDNDPDGVCSAVIMAKCVERLRGKKVDMHFGFDRKQHAITASMLSQLRKAKINKLITTDFSLEQTPETIKQLEPFCEILIVDHHKIYNNVNRQRTILYKPQLFIDIEPSRYCTGKLAYDAASRVVNVSDLDWIAAAACIADIATAPWQSWLMQVFKKYKIRSNTDLFKTDLGQVAATITSAAVYDIKLIDDCFDVFYKSKGPKDVLKSKLGNCKKVVDKELYLWVRRFSKHAERYGELRIFEIKPKFQMQGPISTVLGLKYPHYTILVVDTKDGFMKVSARRGDGKIAVNTLLEKAIEGFHGANAGGHVQAAGAGLNKKNYSLFKKRVIKLV